MRETVIIEAVAGADGKPSGRWRIRVIRAGLSGNGNFYPDATLRAAVPLFEGARVFVKGDKEHLAGEGKDFRNLIGGLSDATFGEGAGADSGEIQATLTLLDPDGPEATKLKEAWDRGMAQLFGFSIDAVGEVERRRIGTRTVKVATKLTGIKSVDLIVEPGAGGEVVGLIESKGSVMDGFELSEAAAADIVKASGLAAGAAKRVLTKFRAGADMSEAALRESIADAKAYAAPSDSGAVQMGDFPRIEVGDGPHEKACKRLDAFFDPAHKDHRAAQSIREAYVDMTGDRTFTGLIANCNQQKLRESLDSQSWPQVLGDSIARRIVTEYRRPGIYDVWRPIVNVVPRPDFRMNHTTRFGGYGDLPIVNEGGAYLSLTSPTDEEATYAVKKRGGTEDLTLEMIANDDVMAVRRIPEKLTGSAKRTIARFVFDFLRTNPTIYDGVALFHATHGNLGSAALDATSLAARRLAMKRQTEMDNAERLGIPPRFLIVPDDLEETAVDLFRRNTENDKNFVQSLTLSIIPVWYWTDANDWCLAADPMDIPSIEIGFLQGQEEPELFIQDMPHVGSMFSNDKVTYKIRHVYGGAVTDFRGLDKSVVA
jgi:hypothetical protein